MTMFRLGLYLLAAVPTALAFSSSPSLDCRIGGSSPVHDPIGETETPRRWSCVRLRSVEDDAAAAVALEPSEERASLEESLPPIGGSEFTSPTFRVYIEDTDAYGVMYNSNYLRCYERALSHVPREKSDGGDSGSGRWILSCVTNQKFRSSPALGEEYIIRGEKVEEGAATAEETEVWQLEMVTKNDKEDWTIHNSATVTLKRATNQVVPPSLVSSMSSTIHQSNDGIAVEEEFGKMFEQRYIPYHDEFDNTHYENHQHIPIRSAMNYFERSRTSYLGGPDVLRKMQVEDDLLWVVTSVDGGELFLDSIALEHSLDDVTILK